LRAFETGGEHMFLIGENYTSRGDQELLRYYLGPHTLSGEFDFPVMWTLREFLAGRAPAKTLAAEVIAGELAWAGSGAVMSPFLGNHDVPRFISDVNGDPLWQPRQSPPPQPTLSRPYELLRLGWLFVMTQPGAPTIYYGDDIGLAGAYDPDNRRAMRFDAPLSPLPPEQAATLSHLQNLGLARRCSTALRRGVRFALPSPPEAADRVYVYARDAQDGYPAFAALNASELPQTLTIPLTDLSSPLAPDATFTNVLASPQPELEPVQKTLTIALPPRQGALILTDPRCK
jgi:glycosidase